MTRETCRLVCGTYSIPFFLSDIEFCPYLVKAPRHHPRRIIGREGKPPLRLERLESRGAQPPLNARRPSLRSLAKLIPSIQPVH